VSDERVLGIVRRAIVDRYNAIGPGERLGHDLEADRGRHHVTEAAIVVVPMAPVRAHTNLHE
jgi:glucose-1-phosphate adenylyltransferase